MNDDLVIHFENGPAVLQEAMSEFSDETKLYVEQISQGIFNILDSSKTIKFDRLIRLINYVFETHPHDYINWAQRSGKDSLWSLKILTLSLLLWIKTDQALKLFWEHWESVKNNPDENNHPNIRELDMNWIETVKIYWFPFEEKNPSKNNT